MGQLQGDHELGWDQCSDRWDGGARPSSSALAIQQHTRLPCDVLAGRPRGICQPSLWLQSWPYVVQLKDHPAHSKAYQLFQIPKIQPCVTRYIGKCPSPPLPCMGGRHQNCMSWAGLHVSGIIWVAVMLVRIMGMVMMRKGRERQSPKKGNQPSLTSLFLPPP